MWTLYNILFPVVFLCMLPHYLMRMLRRGGYRHGFMQRFARYDVETLRRLAEHPRIWIHAVSVGEMFVALRFMAEWRARRPGVAFIVTTTTSTGHRIGRDRMDPVDVLLYVPADFPPIVRKALDCLRPQALLLTESELWPNLIRLAHGRGVPVALINGRISESSYRGYAKVRPLASSMLGAIDLLLVQTEADAERLRRLGAVPARVMVTGTVKYDMAASAAPSGKARTWLAALGVSPVAPVIVGGSTWPGEEAALLRAYEAIRRDMPAVRLVLVPRHAERRGEVEQEIVKAGFACVKRSTAAPDTRAAGPEVILVDSTGELADFFDCATVVFVGKSLLHHGGQNFIEPAQLGKPVITGPNLENFEEMKSDFLRADALQVVQDEPQLVAALREVLGDGAKAAAWGRRGQQVVASRLGAVAAMVDRVDGLIQNASARGK